MSEHEEGKICFVIAPIGKKGSNTRKRSDRVLKLIIAPAAETCGYKTIRADEMPEPGMITSQIIVHLLTDPLVVADLTGHNPNVFYELAIRHYTKKPCVQLIEEQVDETIPFDVAQLRTIRLEDNSNPDSVASCKDELVKQIQAIDKDPTKFVTPVSIVLDQLEPRQAEVEPSTLKEAKEESQAGDDLLQECINILRYLSQTEGSPSETQIARSLNFSLEKTRHFLDILMEEDLIDYSFYLGTGATKYYLSSKGRKYLFDRDLLE